VATRETTVKLTVADNFSGQLRAFATALDQSDKAIKKSSESMSLHQKVSATFANANQQLAAGLKGGATLALASLPALALGAGAAMAKMGMDMQQTRVAFTSLTGSAELANKHLEDLRAFAAKTPFQFNELTDASKKMQAFGFSTEQVIPMMTDIGDAVSALGAGSQGIDSVVRALGQMQAKGKVSAEEMNQLTEVGINGWKYLAEGMGKTTAEVMKMSEKGLLPADAAIQNLLKGMREDFGGGMAAQSKTAAGQLSNLADSITEIGTTIGEIMVPALTTAITKLGEFANTLKVGVQIADLIINKGPKEIGEAFKQTALNMQQAVRDGKMSITDYNNGIRGMADSISIIPPAMRNAMYAEYEMTEATKDNKFVMLDQAEALRKSDAELKQFNDTRDESMRNWGRETEAVKENTISLKEQEAARRDLADAMTGNMDLAVQYTKNAKELTDMERELAGATGKQREELEKQIEAFKKSSEVERATSLFNGLNKALEEGKLSPQQYAERMGALNDVAHLYTDSALKAATAQGILGTQLTDPATNDYALALRKNRDELDGLTEAERAAAESSPDVFRQRTAEADKYRDALDKVPKRVETEVVTTYKSADTALKAVAGDSMKERREQAEQAAKEAGGTAQSVTQSVNTSLRAANDGVAGFASKSKDSIKGVTDTTQTAFVKMADTITSKFGLTSKAVSDAFSVMQQSANSQMATINTAIETYLPTYRELIYKIVIRGEPPEGNEAPRIPGTGAQHGANLIVPDNPRGGMQDYYPVVAAPGERIVVQTVAQQQQQRGGAGKSGGDTYNYNTTINDKLAATMWLDKLRRERVQRSEARMGV
jgi:tape measure domain-containing protein